jgi:predicted RNA binding protein YcfA (HicA-like mRNA interferase family)
MRPSELLARIQQGHLTNVRFNDAQRLLEALGFELDRTRGSHHIYRHPTLREKMNLQPVGRQAKPYQLRQVLQVVERYDLKVEDPQ